MCGGQLRGLNAEQKQFVNLKIRARTNTHTYTLAERQLLYVWTMLNVVTNTMKLYRSD